MCNRLTAVRTFDAAVEAVYRAWTSSSTLVAPVAQAEMDAEVGGQIRISTGASEPEELTGVFVTVQPLRRLVYTWRWGSAAEETIVDVLFHPAGSRTVVEVQRGGFVDLASLESHLAGWATYFDGLTTYL